MAFLRQPFAKDRRAFALPAPGSSPEAEVPALRPRARRSAQRRPAARLLQPLPLLGLALVLISLAGYWSVYRATTARTPVLIAARDLAADGVLRPGDLRAAELAGDPDVLAAFVREAELNEVLGRRLGVALPRGLPLARALLEEEAPAAPALTLAVPALHALGGALRPGDRVTVLATFGRGSGRARARAVARGLEVLAVGRAPATLDPGGATIPVTVALPDPALASALALANAEAALDLLREGRRGQTAPIPPAREQEGG